MSFSLCKEAPNFRLSNILFNVEDIDIRSHDQLFSVSAVFLMVYHLTCPLVTSSALVNCTCKPVGLVIEKDQENIKQSTGNRILYKSSVIMYSLIAYNHNLHIIFWY